MLSSIETSADDLFSLSDKIWDNPEIAFKEHISSNAICDYLKENGFDVQTGIAELPTAFRASYGNGKPNIALLGEFDALSGLSQKSMSFIQEPDRKNSNRNGHGCGHHGIASGAATSAVGIKNYLDNTGCPGTITVMGCPGEEGGSGKSFMVRDGAFDDTDCAVTWHPADTTSLFSGRCLAVISATFSFNGISAHAAGQPFMGRSALDAVELMNVGSNFLREHIIPDARIHYAITDAGGTSPNVVQPQASVYYYVRAPQGFTGKRHLFTCL